MLSKTGDEKVDRLLLVVSCNGVDQLLAVPQLTTGTGHAISDAIIKTINEWNLNNDSKAFSFDTTSANTGRHNNTCTLVEAKLGHDALYLVQSNTFRCEMFWSHRLGARIFRCLDF